MDWKAQYKCKILLALLLQSSWIPFLSLPRIIVFILNNFSSHICLNVGGAAFSNVVGTISTKQITPKRNSIE